MAMSRKRTFSRHCLVPVETYQVCSFRGTADSGFSRKLSRSCWLFYQYRAESKVWKKFFWSTDTWKTFKSLRSVTFPGLDLQIIQISHFSKQSMYVQASVLHGSEAEDPPAAEDPPEAEAAEAGRISVDEVSRSEDVDEWMKIRLFKSWDGFDGSIGVEDAFPSSWKLQLPKLLRSRRSSRLCLVKGQAREVFIASAKWGKWKWCFGEVGFMSGALKHLY